jgi:hypothetical protein
VVSIVATFAVLVCISYGMASVAYDDAPKLLYWTWAYPIVTVDSAVKMACFAYVTHIWLPPALAGAFHGKSSLAESAERGMGEGTSRLNENADQQRGEGSKGSSRREVVLASVQGQAPQSHAEVSIVPGISSYHSMAEQGDSDSQDGYV